MDKIKIYDENNESIYFNGAKIAYDYPNIILLLTDYKFEPEKTYTVKISKNTIKIKDGEYKSTNWTN